MMKLFILALAMLADRYVSNVGSGSACTSLSPCTMQTGINGAAPGDRVIAKAGTFTATAGMVNPTAGINGTAGNYITVTAETAGTVLIDGQNARIPCSLGDNDYWIIEDIDCGNSTDSALRVGSVGAPSNHNIVRRVNVFDASSSANVQTMANLYSCDNLFEDVSIFGTGRESMIDFGTPLAGDCPSDQPNIFRRVWAQFYHTTASEPKCTSALFYDHRNNLYENVILTWAQLNGSYTNTYGITCDGGLGTESNRDQNFRMYGSIIYLRSGVNFTPTYLFLVNNPGGGVNDLHIQDVLSFVPADKPTKVAAYLDRCNQSDLSTPCSSPDLTVTDATFISTAASTINAQWVQTNVQTGSTMASVYGAESLYINNGSRGATICNRYVNGVLTGTPLFPWPMNQRTIDAMTAAGYTPVDITADIETIAGTVPSDCSEPPPTLLGTNNSGLMVGNGAPNSTDLPCLGKGEVYIQLDATAGRNFWVCTATNTWTQQ